VAAFLQLPYKQLNMKVKMFLAFIFMVTMIAFSPERVAAQRGLPGSHPHPHHYHYYNHSRPNHGYYHHPYHHRDRVVLDIHRLHLPPHPPLPRHP
jgi:hypothetical protein